MPPSHLLNGRMPSKSPSLSSASTAASFTSGDSIYYLPRFVPDLTRGKHIVFNAAVVTNNRPRQASFYDFNVKWVASSTEAKQIYDKLFTCQDSNNALVDCDGFCGKKVLADEMEQFGQCEHNICNHCMSTATHHVYMFDGTPGCCNKKCVDEEMSRLALVASSASNESVSFASNESASFVSSLSASSTSSVDPRLIRLKVLHFYKEENELKRDLVSCVMMNSTPISKMIEKLRGFCPLLSKSLIFYTTDRSIRRDELIPLPRAGHERRLDSLSNGKDQLFLVVAGPGVYIY